MKIPGPNPPKPRYVDRPDLMETYADILERYHTDGEVLTLEFCVQRMDYPIASAPPQFTCHPTARIVMPLSNAADMVAKIYNMLKTAEELKKKSAMPMQPRGKGPARKN